MKKYSKISGFIAFVILLQTICLTGFPASAEDIGTDVPFDPYEGYTPIYTAADLNAVRNDLNGNYYLANDIVFQESDFEEGGAYYNDGDGWLAIGKTPGINGIPDFDLSFNGIFDGYNHSIIGLKLTPQGSGTSTALFAKNSGVIRRLSVVADLTYTNTTSPLLQECSVLCIFNSGEIESCSVSGNIEANIFPAIPSSWHITVAGLVIFNSGSIQKCFNNADIEVTTMQTDGSHYISADVAGICSNNYGNIRDCFNTGDIIKTPVSIQGSDLFDSVAGISGNSAGPIQFCFNTGKIQNGSYESALAGYYGSSSQDARTDCVFLDNTSIACYRDAYNGLANSRKATISQMKQSATYQGWDFINVWEITENVSFPRLRTDFRNTELQFYDFAYGNGTAESPYVITSEAQFRYIQDHDDCHFRLDSDIQFGAVKPDFEYTFYGVLDGNGHTLTDIFTLFAYNNGTIRNLGIRYLQAGEVEVRTPMGGFADQNNGVIENCRISGDITITYAGERTYDLNFGGIAAENEGIIRECSSELNTYIISDNIFAIAAGGISAENFNSITESVFKGAIFIIGCKGDLNVGGIAGANKPSLYSRTNGTIERCFFAGDISAQTSVLSIREDYLGGIVGANISSLYADKTVYVRDCFSIGTVSLLASAILENSFFTGQACVGGIAGFNDNRGEIVSCYNAGSAEGITDWDSNPAKAGGCIGINLGTLTSVLSVDLGIPGVGLGINDGTGTVQLFPMDEMRTADPYQGFDFNNVWMFTESDDFYYPVLKNMEFVYTKKPVAVRITRMPSKVSYTEDESFDFSDMQVSCFYNNGTTALTDQYDVFSLYDLYYGNNELFIYYDDGSYYYTDFFEIQITPKAFTSITINTPPEYTSYFQNEYLDLSGATITIHYADKTENVIEITPDMVDVDILTTIGTTEVNVTFFEKSASFNVQVYSPLIQSSVYPIDRANGYIGEIAAGTTVSALIRNIQQKDFAFAVKNDSLMEDSDILGTGCILAITDGYSVLDALMIVVPGDTNGDGAVSITDMLSVKSHLLKKSTLTGEFAQAGDTSGDNSISITDFIQIKAQLLGKK